LIGTLDQQNMPGTVDSYPNWIQKTPLAIEEIFSDKIFRSLSQMFNQII
jgi:4-alpha-glucanotransferase